MEIAKRQDQGIVSFNYFDESQFLTMQRVCKMFSSSELVPEMYRATSKDDENKAMANCMIALEMAQRIGASPLMIMQNMTPIYGKPAWSSKFLIATINTCGRFNPLQYKFNNKGKVGKVEYIDYVWNQQSRKKEPLKKVFDGSNIDNIECIAYTTAKNSDGVLESSPIDIVLSVQEGWYMKNGSKWQTMTRQMLMYRSASFWVNAYAPELSMGMRTVEDIQDTIDIEYDEVKTTEKENSTVLNVESEQNATEKQPEAKEEPKNIDPPTKVESKAEPKVEPKAKAEPVKQEVKPEPKVSSKIDPSVGNPFA